MKTLVIGFAFLLICVVIGVAIFVYRRRHHENYGGWDRLAGVGYPKENYMPYKDIAGGPTGGKIGSGRSFCYEGPHGNEKCECAEGWTWNPQIRECISYSFN